MISECLASCSHLICVPVIASFSSKGEIKPLYVSVSGVQLKIENFTIENDRDFVWSNFFCVVIDNDIKKRIKLCYHFQEHAWFIDMNFKQSFPYFLNRAKQSYLPDIFSCFLSQFLYIQVPLNSFFPDLPYNSGNHSAFSGYYSVSI